MRLILLAGMMSMATAAAGAESSIDNVKTNDTTTSIDYITCPACAPLKTKKVEKPTFVLKPGTQKVEVKDVDGVLKVYRTEAWLGGSPVTYVSKASTDLIDKTSAEAVPADDQKNGLVTIDKNTTSAVNADMSGAAAQPKAAQHFDAQDIQLRLK